MTGAPAQTWRKFRFSTAPAWAAVFLLLLCTGVGLLIVFIAIYLVSRRASGYLPLTRTSSRRVALAAWIPAGLISGALVLVTVAFFVGGVSSGTSGHITRTLVYTNWVQDAKSTSGPHPGYAPALTGLTGDDIRSASAAIDQNGAGWVVNVTFTTRGANVFDRLTAANVAACQIDPTSGTACPQRFLTIWLDLTQRDLDRWDDPSYRAMLLVPYDATCLPSATVPCGKFVIDALTQEEITGGEVQISGNFNQQSAIDFANAIPPGSTTATPVVSAIAWGLAVVALLALVAGVVGALVIRRFVGPRATVRAQPSGYHEYLVELRNVHPAFVAAVLQLQQSRAAQYSSPQPPPNPPLATGST